MPDPTLTNHKTEAERLLRSVDQISDPETAMWTIAAAQVHATLALVDATTPRPVKVTAELVREIQRATVQAARR